MKLNEEQLSLGLLSVLDIFPYCNNFKDPYCPLNIYWPKMEEVLFFMFCLNKILLCSPDWPRIHRDHVCNTVSSFFYVIVYFFEMVSLCSSG